MNLQLLNGIITGIIAGNKDLYNPTYFYGPDDMVLDTLYTVVSDYKETHPEDMVIWVNVNDFTCEMITAIKENTMTAFRKKYRSCDMLVLDRVEQLPGRKSTQQELYEIIDCICMKCGQIVFGGSVPPSKIEDIEARNRAQMEGALICCVDMDCL